MYVRVRTCTPYMAQLTTAAPVALMTRSPAERARDYRSRHQRGLDAVLIDIDRELVLAPGLMSASDYDNTVERLAVLVALRPSTRESAKIIRSTEESSPTQSARPEARVDCAT